MSVILRKHPHPGTRLTSRRLVSLWQAAGSLRWVLIPDPQGELATQALLCTDPAMAPVCIVEWFVMRCQLEVTLQEVRAHQGAETQRQWSDRAIARTTPILIGMFSWVALAAHSLQKRYPLTHRQADWYPKSAPTFVDAIAQLRPHLWVASEGFSTSLPHPDSEKAPAAIYNRLLDPLAYAA